MIMSKIRIYTSDLDWTLYCMTGARGYNNQFTFLGENIDIERYFADV